MEEFVYFLCYPKGITILMLPERDYNSPHWNLRKQTFQLVQKRSYKIENYYPLSLSTYDSKIYNFLLNFVFSLLEPIFLQGS